MLFDVSTPKKYKSNLTIQEFVNEVNNNNHRIEYNIQSYTNKDGEERRKVIGNIYSNSESNLLNTNITQVEDYEYSFGWKSLVFLVLILIILYELYEHYKNQSLIIKQKVEKCMKEYYSNDCNKIHDINEINSKTIDISIYLTSFCDEKLKCISYSQTIFTEGILSNVSSYSIFLSLILIIIFSLVIKKYLNR